MAGKEGRRKKEGVSFPLEPGCVSCSFLASFGWLVWSPSEEARSHLFRWQARVSRVIYEFALGP
jgi:hypothetical protein